MTVASTIQRNDYVGSGITGPYAYTYRIFVATDLLVITADESGNQSTLAYPADYTVTGVGNKTGGTITLTTALADDWRLTIQRAPPITQARSIRNQGPFFAETVEDALDAATMVDQYQQDAIDRSVKLRETDGADDIDILLPAPQAGYVLGWNASADGFENVLLGAGGGSSSANVPLTTALRDASGGFAAGYVVLDRVTVGSGGGYFGAVPEPRVGAYFGQTVDSDTGTYPLSDYAYGVRILDTIRTRAAAATLIGFSCEPTFDDAGSHAGTQVISLYSDLTLAPGMVVDSAIGLLVDTASRASGALVDDMVGIYVNAQAGGGTMNRALWTVEGDHFFGGPARFSAPLSGDSSINVDHGNINANDGNVFASGLGAFGGLAIGNSFAATTLGTVVAAIPIISQLGAPLGKIAIYDTIT